MGRRLQIQWTAAASTAKQVAKMFPTAGLERNRGMMRSNTSDKKVSKTANEITTHLSIVATFCNLGTQGVN
eukprot:1230861-Amphidinium_carterae.1